MKKKIGYLLLLVVGSMGYSQSCPSLISPASGATNVPVETVISWQEVVGVPGYDVALGTSPGANDIFEQFVGSATFLTPPLGLPSNTEVFVTITLFFFNRPNIVCSSTSFFTETVSNVPQCTTIGNPRNTDVDVNVGTNISWGYAPRATSYLLTLGTSPGSGDIVSNLDVGNVLFFNPPADLPPNTDIYVEITPVNGIGNAVGCIEEIFTTGSITVLPGCTSLTFPINGQTNVPLTPLLEWVDVPGAIGYRVSIGTNPFDNNILNRGTFTRNSTFVIEFEANRTIFVTIVPFNDAGEALGCAQQSFSTIEGCGPFFDPVTGALVDLFPELNFTGNLSICENATPVTVSTDAVAEGFRWIRQTQSGTVIEELSDTRDAAITEAGFYRLEVFNFADPGGSNFPCITAQDFTVDIFEGPTINSIDVQGQGDNLQLVINATGTGTYEYAVNNANGPFQDSNVFNNVPRGNSTVYVRDKNDINCVVSELVEQDLVSEGFPNFFTPNGDGINDFWQFVPLPNTTPLDLEAIFIFNRFGQLITQIDPDSPGWNGTLNGRPLPASDYWFRAISSENQKFTGHFALKR
ncbi:T9SS type B sorting domain-containing protein [Spongiimicrobium sp. 3-5]|uniref:T9SS type B sorting domain-containing protein n=1 Tax=Spongiimicrobium sp. 3-5 TaxID=3332596 RepID=UPI0039809AD5